MYPINELKESIKQTRKNFNYIVNEFQQHLENMERLVNNIERNINQNGMQQDNQAGYNYNSNANQRQFKPANNLQSGNRITRSQYRPNDANIINPISGQ